MSPERLIRRSNRGVDYIIGQRYYNLVSFPSPSLTHNRSAPLALGGSVGDDDLDRTWSTGRAQEGVPLGRRTWYAA